MKKVTSKIKLSLNKKTIATLKADDLHSIKGGRNKSDLCSSVINPVC